MKKIEKYICPVENIFKYFVQIYKYVAFSLLFLIYKINRMKKQLEAVKLFHESFGLGVSPSIKANLGNKTNILRFELMREENEEYFTAVQNNDIVEVADALGDMLYILCGTILEHGLQHKIEEVFDEIQRSNMSKLDANGKPIYREDGKVLKGPNYFVPNIKNILEE